VHVVTREKPRLDVPSWSVRARKTAVSALWLAAFMVAFEVIDPIDDWPRLLTETGPRALAIFSAAHLIVWPYVRAWGRRRQEENPYY
jgi:hypothetical protein